MANPNFIPNYSTDEIYRETDQARCLSDDLDAIETDIESIKETLNNLPEEDTTEYAPANHNHDGVYAASSHNHDGVYAASAHNHDSSYAASNHTHADKADLVNGKVPVSQIPDDLKEIRIAADITARNAMTGLFAGLSVYVVDATADTTVTSGGAWYLYDGTNWIKTAEGESMDAVLQWANIVGKPDTFPPASHTHTAEEVGAIPTSLMLTSANGSYKYSYTVESGKNILTEIAALGIGVHTVYSQSGASGNPKTTEAWRFLVHKTHANYGWVIGFGSFGSVYSNYLDGGTWRGWNAEYDASPAPIWQHPTGEGYYMSEGQTVTPAKKLSECANGWMLIWSDYDPDTSATNNHDQCCTPIYKKNGECANWNGEGFLCAIPVYANEDGTANNISIKNVNVYDNKIVGKAKNSVGERRDAVLRAIYEF